MLRDKYNKVEHSWEPAWSREMGHIEWAQVYKLGKGTTICTGYQSLQYKILTRIVATNGLLHRIGIKDSDN